MNKIKWERLVRNLVHTNWQADFVKDYGIESVLYCLSKLHLKYTSTVIEHTREDEMELHLMLLCIERVKGTKNLASKRAIRLLFQLLEFAGKKNQTDALHIINILTHICRWVNPGMILECMKYFLFSYEDVVRDLMTEIFSGSNLLFKVNFFDLIAATINAALDISVDKMEEMRDEYYKVGITFKALKDLQADFPDEELVDQIQGYIRDSNLRTNLILDFDTRASVRKKQMEIDELKKNMSELRQDHEKMKQKLMKTMEERDRYKKNLPQALRMEDGKLDADEEEMKKKMQEREKELEEEKQKELDKEREGEE